MLKNFAHLVVNLSIYLCDLSGLLTGAGEVSPSNHLPTLESSKKIPRRKPVAKANL